MGVDNSNGTIESQHVMVYSMMREEDEQHHIIKEMPQKQYEEATKRILFPGLNEFSVGVALLSTRGGIKSKVVITE